MARPQFHNRVVAIEDNRFVGLLREIEEAINETDDLELLRKVESRLFLLKGRAHARGHNLRNGINDN